MAAWRTWTIAGDAREHTVVVRLDRMRGRAQVWVDAQPVIAREFAYSLDVDFPVGDRTAHLELLYKPDLRWLVRIGSEKVAPSGTAKPANAAALLEKAPALPPSAQPPPTWHDSVVWFVAFGFVQIAKLDGYIVLALAALSYGAVRGVLGVKKHPMMLAASFLYGYAGWLVHASWTSGAAAVFAFQAVVVAVLTAWLLTHRSWLPTAAFLLVFGAYTWWFLEAVVDWKQVARLGMFQITAQLVGLGLMAHGYWRTRQSDGEPIAAPSDLP